MSIIDTLLPSLQADRAVCHLCHKAVNGPASWALPTRGHIRQISGERSLTMMQQRPQQIDNQHLTRRGPHEKSRDHYL